MGDVVRFTLTDEEVAGLGRREAVDLVAIFSAYPVRAERDLVRALTYYEVDVAGWAAAWLRRTVARAVVGRLAAATVDAWRPSVDQQVYELERRVRRRPYPAVRIGGPRYVTLELAPEYA